jgi:hypothetical protein
MQDLTVLVTKWDKPIYVTLNNTMKLGWSGSDCLLGEASYCVLQDGSML